ncbi:prepilin-type N-terminal cleavage/methylation domain-containing protein [Thermodesulfovibrionales bacterium]|nr:prepilin-type N-terminal cleavage/methylation domain-containing protein [Thermodesulfovibrionales bacterium]MCL0086843.1 prepilin-type N-terminal cleavage/methylation domain-containing protein [Thermodesulfovibrionales bacterium]
MLPFRHSLQSNKRSQESKSRRARESKSQDSRLTTLRLLTHNRGFSLIEMLISMAILGILLAAIATIVYSQNKHHAAQNEIVEMQNNARMAMDFVTRTMKGLDRDATDAMLNAMLAVNHDWFTNEGENPSDLTFITDETAFGGTRDTHRFAITHGGVDGANTLTYAFEEGGGVSPYERGDRNPLALNITEFSIQRRDAGGNPVASFAAAARIDITITAETENPLPTTGAPGTMTLESSVFLRN